MLSTLFAQVTRALPGVRPGPAGEAACRPPASRGEGAEGAAWVRPMRPRYRAAGSVGEVQRREKEV